MTIPEQLGPYRIDGELGSGAMGVVYRATHVETGLEVALKVIAPGLVTDELLVARFEREMAIVQKLTHPNIVRCFEVGTDGKQRYFAMELVVGGSIGGLIDRKGRLSWQEVIHYGQQVCSALEYAHERGVIHRDLKPANLLIDDDGALKLADFGLALDPDATALTAAGRTVGTVNYMSPEQVRGKPPVSAQTDLYALGCVMFEMLTGHPPFDCESPAETMFKQLGTRPPRVSAIALDCPIWLEALILKLLEKEPLQRPIDARAVAYSLRRIEDRVASGVATVSHTGSDAVSHTTAIRGGRVVDEERERKPRRVNSRSKRRFFIASAVIGLALWTGSLFWLFGDQSGSRAERLWIDSLGNSHAAVRAEATRALGDLGPTAKAAVPGLIIALEDTDSDVRAGAVRALERIGPKSSAAIPALMRLSKADDQESVRQLALHALDNIRIEKGTASRTVTALFTVAATALIAAAFYWAWRRFGPTSVPMLIEDLKSDRVAVRRRATRVLSLLGQDANTAVPALLQALKDGDEGVRRGADVALNRIGLQNKTAVPDLITALGDRDPFVRTRAAVLLGKLGPEARLAGPALIGSLRDPIDLVRVEAVQAIGKIEVASEQAVTNLNALMRDKSYSVRQAASMVLRKLQPARPRAPKRREDRPN